jgi:hypothetical protein
MLPGLAYRTQKSRAATDLLPKPGVIMESRTV